MWQYKRDDDFVLANALFEAVKLVKNAGKDKYNHLGYGIGFDNQGAFSLSNSSGFGKNVIIFVADMSSSVHVDNKIRIF